MDKKLGKPQNLLDAIDSIYLDQKKKYSFKKDNNDFSVFIPIKFTDYESSCNYVIKKAEKAKILILEGKQRIYLSDLHIIKTILSLEKEDIEWFIEQFVLLYNDKTKKVNFKINKTTYGGIGLNTYENNKEIILSSDSKIRINDFIIVLNFIFTKDKLWEIMSNKKDFSKRTLRKYISLIDFYSKHSIRSKEYLSFIDYPINCQKPIDNRNINIKFISKEKFDISLYK